MIINGTELLKAAPIKNMQLYKKNDPELIGSYGLSEIGYDIRIKQAVGFYPARGNEKPTIVVTDEIGSKVIRGRFCLASSVEEFQMPEHLGAIGHDKSTLARLGVQVFNTVTEPGWNGFLTLELVFNGEEDVFIPAGSGIMQMIFHEIKEPTSYVGKYQGQSNEPVPAKFC